jgi:protein LTV1
MDSGSSRAYARLPPSHAAEPGAAAASEGAGGSAGPSDHSRAFGDKFGNGEVEKVEYESDGDIEAHPFLAGLKAPPKEEGWDAETILSTYSTTENHPTMIKLARRPKNGQGAIQLDPRTGLPLGVMLPLEEERARAAAEGAATGEGSEDEGEEGEDEGEEGEEGEPFNAGAARPKKECKDEKKARKAEAKEAQAARRAEKKATKKAFSHERTKQSATAIATKQPAGMSFTTWG